jgi:hypothetical protein
VLIFVCVCAGLNIPPRDLALLCQKASYIAENIFGFISFDLYL